jgi:hypothetical protein
VKWRGVFDAEVAEGAGGAESDEVQSGKQDLGEESPHANRKRRGSDAENEGNWCCKILRAEPGRGAEILGRDEDGGWHFEAQCKQTRERIARGISSC